jgi:hypothetical protein
VCYCCDAVDLQHLGCVVEVAKISFGGRLGEEESKAVEEVKPKGQMKN